MNTTQTTSPRTIGTVTVRTITRAAFVEDDGRVWYFASINARRPNIATPAQAATFEAA